MAVIIYNDGFRIRTITYALQTQTLYSSQGTPCEPIPTGKNLFSLQGTPVLIAGSLFSLQGFPCKPLYFPVRDCSVHILTEKHIFEIKMY